MRFQDESIPAIDPKNHTDIINCIVNYFCCKEPKNLDEQENKLASKLISKMVDGGINCSQFNELLLLLNEDRISKDFFDFLFECETVTDTQLREGIAKFRGFALLCIGNFRVAFEKMSFANAYQLETLISPYDENYDSLFKSYTDRPEKAIDITTIPKDQTWFNGNITIKKIEREARYAMFIEKEGAKTIGITDRELVDILDHYTSLAKTAEAVKSQALENTSVYLTWDYMDVYFATSMRNNWEFENIFEFIRATLDDQELKELKIRYFDPTQSQCRNRIDKGLLEGLMLKRAKCTIYMAQESDTMGKDSELASTLAQGKPVIAYVPKIDVQDHAEKIKNGSLDFIRLQLQSLTADGFLNDQECAPFLNKIYQNYPELVDKFISRFREHRKNQPFSLIKAKDETFKKEFTEFPQVCKLLATAEQMYYNKRADTLRESHPLSMQVNLNSGVANGVLVVRDSKESVKLLKRILTNTLEFTIKQASNQGDYGIILEENISKSPFRVVTSNEKLTNSFWNFYLK